jgi:hypothetical protein
VFSVARGIGHDVKVHAVSPQPAFARVAVTRAARAGRAGKADVTGP